METPLCYWELFNVLPKHRTTHTHTHRLKSCFWLLKEDIKYMKAHAEILKLRSSFNEPTHLHTLYYPSLIHAYTLDQIHLNRVSSTYQIQIARSKHLRKEIYN